MISFVSVLSKISFIVVGIMLYLMLVVPFPPEGLVSFSKASIIVPTLVPLGLGILLVIVKKQLEKRVE